jgi:hypothetical protein
MECLEKDPARRPTSAEAVSTRLDAVSLESAWTIERAERWWAMHRPLPADARRVAEVLLSQEGQELRIGPRVMPRELLPWHQSVPQGLSITKRQEPSA